jgi:hypothetical protein
MNDPIEMLNKLSVWEGGPKTLLPLPHAIDFGVALDQHLAYCQKQFEMGWFDAEAGNSPCEVSESYNTGYQQSYAAQQNADHDPSELREDLG